MKTLLALLAALLLSGCEPKVYVNIDARGVDPPKLPRRPLIPFRQPLPQPRFDP